MDGLFIHVVGRRIGLTVGADMFPAVEIIHVSVTLAEPDLPSRDWLTNQNSSARMACSVDRQQWSREWLEVADWRRLAPMMTMAEVGDCHPLEMAIDFAANGGTELPVSTT